MIAGTYCRTKPRHCRLNADSAPSAALMAATSSLGPAFVWGRGRVSGRWLVWGGGAALTAANPSLGRFRWRGDVWGGGLLVWQRGGADGGHLLARASVWGLACVTPRGTAALGGRRGCVAGSAAAQFRFRGRPRVLERFELVLKLAERHGPARKGSLPPPNSPPSPYSPLFSRTKEASPKQSNTKLPQTKQPKQTKAKQSKAKHSRIKPHPPGGWCRCLLWRGTPPRRRPSRGRPPRSAPPSETASRRGA
jgi:hypothetical protein